MKPIPLLIDTDPGVDDALAILMALAEPSVEVVGLTVAAGNVGLRHTVANALKLLEVADARVPVFPGCAEPLLFPAEDAAFVHGRDGFGDTAYAAAAARPEDEHAALAICRLARQHEGELLLVALGPLTNLALALSLDPALPDRVRRLVVMGGAVTGRGNLPQRAQVEFNLGFDPEAAHLVFSRWGKFELVDWEAVLRHCLPQGDATRWLQAANPRAAFYGAISRRTRDWSRSRRGEGWTCADALAMAHALEPSAARQCAERHVAVETAGALTRGATVVDWEQRLGAAPNASILLEYDQAAFERRVRTALGA